ncbi:MAG: ATP-binding protein [Actinomycetota bacterium]|nr:ATP-binding protein [Actinomycetota bacterium]
MEINLGLQLPREEKSIPVVRHLCRHALSEVGVHDDCRADIEMALSEACTNALKHAAPGEQYEVHLSLDDRHCLITVVDAGRGFDGRSPTSDPSEERGRGIELMRALVDRVNFESRPEQGTVVHLEKEVAFSAGSLVRGPAPGADRDADD